jgi:hypothetical protein
LRRCPLLLVLLLVLAPAFAHAAGSGLRWNSCQGASNRNFACDRNTSSELLVGSFSSPTSMSMIAAEVYIRITVAEGEIPSWWRMWAVSDCRRGGSNLSVDMSTETECEDPWGGQATGLFAPHSIDSQGVDLRLVMAVPSTSPVSIGAGRPYGLFKIGLQHTRSTGAGSCAGCSTPACIVIERMVLVPEHEYAQDAREVELTDGMSGLGGSGNIAKWQGGTANCAGATAKSSSWSELKRLYK